MRGRYYISDETGEAFLFGGSHNAGHVLEDNEKARAFEAIAAQHGGELIDASGLAVIDTIMAGHKPGHGGGGGGGNGGGNGGGGKNKVVDSYTSGSNNGSGFNIEIDFMGNDWTADLQQAFIDASEFISDIIVGDIGDVFFQGEVIDDVKIEATLTDIDGPGGILGQAGPTVYRTADFLPALGIMEFDTADAADFDAIGLFDDIVFHEMMHVIGFGTMWDLMGLIDIVGQDWFFNGTNATAQYQAEFSASGSPAIETDGGPGTAGGHWDEDTFLDEIMTGYIDDPNYLSNMTVAALEDMGYDTVWNGATSDPYLPEPDIFTS